MLPTSNVLRVPRKGTRMYVYISVYIITAKYLHLLLAYDNYNWVNPGNLQERYYTKNPYKK